METYLFLLDDQMRLPIVIIFFRVDDDLKSIGNEYYHLS